MKRQRQTICAPLAAVSFALVLAVLTGCDGRPEVYAQRKADPSYRKDLEASVAQQKRTNASLATVRSQMDRLEARARAVLPAGATPEQVKAELDANPAKYPGWQTLSARFEQLSRDKEKELADVRRLVRERIVKEAKDQKALAKGEARAKRPSASK